jgi:glycerate-2-kinase
MTTSHKTQLTELVLDALDQMHPKRRLAELISVEENRLIVGDQTYQEDDHNGIYLIGFGKAGAQMGQAVEMILGKRLSGGLVICPEPPSESITGKVNYLEGNHPKPGKETLHSTRKLLSFLDDLPEKAIVINVVSGGTSAMLELPPEKISLEELQHCFDLILSSGANISEMNTMRKQLSQVKGGRLQHHLKNKTLIDIMFSDVPGDNPADIGSGPTVVDDSDRQDGIDLMREYEIYSKLPDSVKTFLESDQPDTKPQKPVLTKKEHQIVMAGTSEVLAQQVGRLAEKRHDWETTIVSPAYSGQLNEVVDLQIAKVNEVKKAAESEENPTTKLLIFHGESYVQVTGDGKGGRNQELALRTVDWLKDHKHISLLSMGTDGIDGPTDAAGAFADGSTAEKFIVSEIDWHKYLKNNDAYNAFEQINGLVKTGATGQNFMDVQLWLAE